MSPKDLQIVVCARLAEEIITVIVGFWGITLSLAADKSSALGEGRIKKSWARERFLHGRKKIGIYSVGESCGGTYLNWTKPEGWLVWDAEMREVWRRGGGAEDF